MKISAVYNMAAACAVALSATAASASPWDAVLGKGAPAAHEADGFSGKARAVFLDGEDWRGRPTRFFAWYGLPEGASADKKCPGVVLVHGGLGTAFDGWVRMWNERGYAAIAMDTCGSVPLKGPVFYDIRETMPHGQDPGAAPESIHSFADHWSFGRPLGPEISGKWTVREP